ncbi:major outer membrane protein [Aliarcobacter skirrowii]|uniref:major outer membrane protein n=1 Tax=Aliarcobacter skirrowii TaxID=28200 RepID=UPI0029B554A9|nr:major outer membrane protein [Aliarcobacter skirrowii]MDX4061543.1 major outer membrane protein [Aliarcobacter skirrowii]
MKKFTKLSLVAAVAVAGLTSANAKPLEEAIKDVEVSGTVTYRYDQSKVDNGSHSQSNNYKINFNLSSKVNDYVKFNTRLNAANAVDGTFTDNGFTKLNSKSGGNEDGNPEVRVSHAYFGLTAIPNTTVNIGKQGLATPWTVATDNDGGEQTGTGIFSVTAVDKFVLGLAYFNQTNINHTDTNKILTDNTLPNFDGAGDIYAATLQANYGIVNAEAWYLSAVDQFDTYALAVHGKADLADNAKVGYEVRYVSLDAGDINSALDKNSLLRVAVDGKVGIVNARVAYTTTDKDGGVTALDQDAQNTSLGWKTNTLGKADAKYLQTTLGVDVLENLNLSVSYNDLESAGNNEESELFGQLTYKMSKNLDGYIRYGTQEVNSLDSTNGRLQVNYKF